MKIQSDGSFFMSCIDMDGNPVKRTPATHPYSFDMHVTYMDGEKEDITGNAYSDRMLQQDYDLTRKLSEKHFGESGDYYDRRDPKKIESFLREWMNLPTLKLIAIQKCCNVSSGYPIWWFGWSV